MDTRNRIAEKAEELYMRFGIRSVSMENMADELGMSKKTLYQYFADKDELVEEVVKRHTQAIRQECEQIALEANDAIHEIFLIMERVMEDFRNMNPMVLFDLQKFHPKGFQRFSEYKNEFLLHFIRVNIERGIREGYYRSDVNLEIMSRFRLESMMIPFNISLYPPTQFNMAETAQLISENFIYGLASLQGHQLIQSYQQAKKNNLS